MNDLPGDLIREELAMLSADLDDDSPESLAVAAGVFFELGALDVTFLSTTMKKSRPGIRLEVLTTEADSPKLVAAILRETTTLGVRRSIVERFALARRDRHLSVLGTQISVKVALWDGKPLKAKAESEQLRALAADLNRPYREVAAEAQAAIHGEFFSED